MIVEEITTSLPFPRRFEDNELDGLVVTNTISMITIWIIIFLYAFTAKIVLPFKSLIPDDIKKFLERTTNSLVWSGIIGTWLAGIMDMTLCSILQLGALSLRASISVFSCLMSFVVLIFNLIFHVILYRKLSTMRKKIDLSEANPYRSRFSMFKIESKICYYYNLVLMTKRLLLPFALVAFHDFPGTDNRGYYSTIVFDIYCFEVCSI